jgi:3-dehydroquinate dehydratase-2
MDILIINGPNLNLLGTREPGIYGDQIFEAYFETLVRAFPDHVLSHFQSNHEGAIVDRLHADGFSPGGIVINGGAYSHTSLAIADAIRAIERPVVGVHISNTFAREAFRHTDFLAPVCKGMVIGLGLDGYRRAVEHLLRQEG